MLKVVPATRPRLSTRSCERGVLADALRERGDRHQPGLRRLRRGPRRADRERARSQISTGNRNFPGKQGKGKTYLAGPAVVAASCVARRNRAARRICNMDTDIRQGRIWVLLDTDGRHHRGHRHRPDLPQRPPGHHRHRPDGPAAPSATWRAGRTFPRSARRAISLTRRPTSARARRASRPWIASRPWGSRPILAPSYSAIYFRNAVNSGLPVMKILDLGRLLAEGALASGDVVPSMPVGKGENITEVMGCPDPMSV